MSDKVNLMSHKKKTTSEQGEDGMIKKALEVLCIEKGYCLEFGAWDGLWKRNTRFLDPKEDWTVLLIECEKDKYETCVDNMKDEPNVICLHATIDLENTNLNDVLDEQGFPKDFDVMSMDIDSEDYYIWEDLKYEPKIVCIEHKQIRGLRPYGGNSSKNPRRGADAGTIMNLGKKKGYMPAGKTKNNLIFIRNDLSESFVEYGT